MEKLPFFFSEEKDRKGRGFFYSFQQFDNNNFHFSVSLVIEPFHFNLYFNNNNSVLIFRLLS